MAKKSTNARKTAAKKQPKESAIMTAIKFVVAVAVPLGGGFLISLLTMDAMKKFGEFEQPPLAPPAWLFPWTVLYILMGVAFFMLMRAAKKTRTKSDDKAILTIYAAQLLLNFAWTPIFFNFGQYWLALVVLVTMWVMILALLAAAGRLSKPAFFMLIPYLLWTTFAAYLNIGIAILN